MSDPGKALEIQHRRDQALKLRTQGMSYRDIASRLGISVAMAHRDVSEALAAIPKHSAEELRRSEQALLDELQAVLMAQVHDPASSRTTQRKAVETLVRVSERRAKLLGLDAPARMMAMVEHHQADPVTEDVLAQPGGALLVAQIEAFVAGVPAQPDAEDRPGPD